MILKPIFNFTPFKGEKKVKIFNSHITKYKIVKTFKLIFLCCIIYNNKQCNNKFFLNCKYKFLIFKQSSKLVKTLKSLESPLFRMVTFHTLHNI